MNKKTAIAIIGSKLGNPSKMPGFSFGISPEHCNVGSKLREVPGSVCSECYACNGNYRYESVQTSHANRYAKLSHPEWISAMIYLIGRETARINNAYFRWHDSGDLQSIEHLLAIVEIARELPKVNFWLPTHEKALLLRYHRQYSAFPRNLAVRLSAPMIDKPVKELGDLDIGYSNVHDREAPNGKECLAYTRNNNCGPCRACWNTRKYRTISYRRH